MSTVKEPKFEQWDICGFLAEDDVKTSDPVPNGYTRAISKDYAVDLAERIDMHTKHSHNCSINKGIKPCTCGLTDLRNEIRALQGNT